MWSLTRGVDSIRLLVLAWDTGKLVELLVEKGEITRRERTAADFSACRGRGPLLGPSWGLFLEGLSIHREVLSRRMVRVCVIYKCKLRY